MKQCWICILRPVKMPKNLQEVKTTSQQMAKKFDTTAPIRHLCAHGLKTGFTLKYVYYTIVKHTLFRNTLFTYVNLGLVYSLAWVRQHPAQPIMCIV